MQKASLPRSKPVVVIMANANQSQADATTVFEIFCNQIGRWCARRADGMVFGTFFERADALHFARRECRDARKLRLIDGGNAGPAFPCALSYG